MNDYKEMIAAALCSDCSGRGKVRFVNGGPWGNEAGWMKCPTCKGSGFTDPPIEEDE